MKKTAPAKKRQSKTKAPAAKQDARDGLEERAMLADLTIGWWEGRRKDSTVTQEVLKDNKAREDAGAWWTRTIPRSALSKVVEAVNKGRATHYKFTLPWLDAGARILSAAMFMEYTAEIRSIGQLFQEGVDEFLAVYPTLVREAHTRLGTLFDSSFFPSADELRGKFKWEVRILPLPSSQDFRVDLGRDETASIKRSIEQQADAAMQTAMGDLWTRLHDAVNNIAERLAEPDAVFRDTMIKNLATLCDLLPKMNIAGNPDLERARQEVAAKLTTCDPEVLRKNKPARADAAKTAADIAKSMAAFMGGK